MLISRPREEAMGSLSFIDTMTEEEARVLWIYGGFGPPESFPGVRVAAVRMITAVSVTGRRTLGRYFATLAPHSGAVALAALLRVLTNRPAPIALPAPAPRSLCPQERSHRTTPARAP